MAQNSLDLSIRKSLGEIKDVIGQRSPSTPSLDEAKLPETGSWTCRAFDSEVQRDPTDIRLRLLEYYENQTLSEYTRVRGNLQDPLDKDDKVTVGTLISSHSKKNRRRLRAMLQLRFRFICTRILRLEIRAQQLSRQWLGAPWFDCTITVLNIRPSSSAIFDACRDRDLWRIKELLESGQAGVFDVEEEVGGLLEHAILGPAWQRGTSSGGSILRSIEEVVWYLLEQGCNPGISFAGESSSLLPAIYHAYVYGYDNIISSLESYGANILYFSSLLPNIFGGIYGPKGVFRRNVQKLRSIGFSDWLVTAPSGHLLIGACGAQDLEEVLFAIEVVGINPDMAGLCDWMTPVRVAAEKHWLQGVAVLIECGVHVNCLGGGPLGQSIDRGRINRTLHYLLSRGADPSLQDLAEHRPWHKVWDAAFDLRRYRAKSWSYGQVEGSLAHLLSHGADPFAPFLTNVNVEHRRYFSHSQRWYDSVGEIRASEVARAWSYPIEYKDCWNHRWDVGGCIKSEFDQCFEVLESTRQLQSFSTWSKEGIIHPASSESENGSITDIEESISDDQQTGLSVYSEAWAQKSCKELQDSGSDELEDPEFFQNATSFNHHIRTEEGRRHLSRFPLVRALCDALQHAGYRAQMDDDGDIWWDCSDGDRYYDAREYQPDHESETPWQDFCDICQRPESYGLGRMVREANEGKRALWEYREDLKNAKRRTSF